MQCEETNLCKFVKNQRSLTPIFILLYDHLIPEIIYGGHSTLSWFCAGFVTYFRKNSLVITQLIELLLPQCYQLKDIPLSSNKCSL